MLRAWDKHELGSVLETSWLPKNNIEKHMANYDSAEWKIPMEKEKQH